MDNRTIYYAPPLPKPATLLILENSKNIRAVSLHRDMQLGRRDPEIHHDITLESGIVSRNHGSFFFSENAYYYRDNDSLNGTFYNGKKLEIINERGSRAVRLQDGDVLRIDRRELNRPHPQAVEMIFSTSFSSAENWHRFSLDGKKQVPIGRDQTDGIALSDFMVSRNHALLKKKGQNWEIIDNKSTNGLAVNQKMITRKKLLHTFDVIRIANTTLIFLGKVSFSAIPS